MNKKDKEALRKQNERLNAKFAALVARVFPTSFSGVCYDDGKPVEFDLGPGKNLYLYWTGKSGTRYCYTPWKCVRGWYWTFNYKPDKGRRLVIKNVVKFRKRSTAKDRAYARYAKEGK